VTCQFDVEVRVCASAFSATFKALATAESGFSFTLRHSKSRQELECGQYAQRDGRSAEHRWRPLFNAAVWLTPTT